MTSEDDLQLDYEVVGKVLAEERKRRNIRQIDFAKKLRIGRSQLCLLETGKRKLSFSMLLVISRHLKVSPVDLLDRILQKHPSYGKRRIPEITEAVEDLSRDTS